MYSKRQLIQFACFVAEEVCRENFEEEAGAFAEIACRKLNNLGIIKKENDQWVYEFGVEE